MIHLKHSKQLKELIGHLSDKNLIIDSVEDSKDELTHSLRSSLQQLQQFIDKVLFRANGSLAEATLLDAEISKIKLSTQRQKLQTEMIASASEEMAQTIVDISNNASTASTESQNAVSVAEESKKIMEDTVSKINFVIESTNELKASIENLHTRIQEVEEVTKFIKDVADQTNLLALNAAIEAARAGEQGRGFAVVADEVRKLAERTTKATADIGSTLNRIKEESSVTNTTMNKSMKEIEASKSHIQNLKISFETVVSHVEKTSDDITRIAAAVEEQSSATEEITKNVEETLKMANLIDNDTNKLLNIADGMLGRNNEIVDAIGEYSIKSGTNTLLERVKADHRLWVKRLYRMYHGHEKISSAGDHHSCRLGKWYYGDASKPLAHLDAFRQLETPHRQLHEKAQDCVNEFNSGEKEKCLHGIMELEKISDVVVDLIEQLKRS
jgi:methyl-accepting chemotaxis protein